MFETRTLEPNDCRRCLGDGRIANDDDGTPWVYWLELPVKNALAVTMGLVRPIPCPECEGTGNAAQTKATN